jgi:hypothetical protein
VLEAVGSSAVPVYFITRITRGGRDGGIHVSEVDGRDSDWQDPSHRVIRVAGD